MRTVRETEWIGHWFDAGNKLNVGDTHLKCECCDSK
jgi:hypothetical protein